MTLYLQHFQMSNVQELALVVLKTIPMALDYEHMQQIPALSDTGKLIRVVNSSAFPKPMIAIQGVSHALKSRTSPQKLISKFEIFTVMQKFETLLVEVC